jgi:hypothetical protein
MILFRTPNAMPVTLERWNLRLTSRMDSLKLSRADTGTV